MARTPSSRVMPRFGAPNLEPFVEAEEAGAFLHYSPQHVKKLARENKIPAHPLGDGKRRRWLFLISELDAMMRARVNCVRGSCSEKDQ